MCLTVLLSNTIYLTSKKFFLCILLQICFLHVVVLFSSFLSHHVHGSITGNTRVLFYLIENLRKHDGEMLAHWIGEFDLFVSLYFRAFKLIYQLCVLYMCLCWWIVPLFLQLTFQAHWVKNGSSGKCTIIPQKLSHLTTATEVQQLAFVHKMHFQRLNIFEYSQNASHLH